MIMSMDLSNPLSLEDQCFLHVICHLEEYLPDRLASLPLHLRQKLLLNLPAADIFQLENTVVAAGIDMEESVWKVLDHNRTLSDWEEPYRFVSSKRTLHTRLSSYIINGELDGAWQLLFSARGCLGIRDWKDVQHHFATVKFGPGSYSPTPHRHVRHFQKECQQIYLMSSLVNDYQQVPVAVYVNCHAFACCKLWKARKTFPTAVLLMKFFSRIEHLELELSGADKVGQFVIEQILSSPQGTLRHLNLSLCAGDTMSGVARLFSPATDPVGVLPRVSAALRKTLGRGSGINPNLPYGGLASIAVTCSVGHSTYVNIDHHLRSVIEYQNSLSSLELRLCDHEAYVPSIPLVATLSSLFHKVQFKKLTLSFFTISGEHFSIILPQFLSAPSGDHEKVLCLDHVTFTGIQIPQTNPDITTTVLYGDALPQKALVLHILERNFPPNVLNCLSAYNYTQLLSSLTVAWYGDPVYPRETVLPSTTMLQHLHFTNVCLALQPDPDAFFVNLFQSPHIKSVHLDSGLICDKRLLPALTQGLRQQTSLGSLEELSLMDNNLAASQESDLRHFFDVLFFLPQLPNLELDLRDNCLRSQHLVIMHKSWRRNAGHSTKQLKHLKVHEVKMNPQARNECERCQLELHEISVSRDFLNKSV